MPIAATDIKRYKTTNNLGGAITANEVNDATLAEVFANISSAEASSGVTKYACIYVRNKHGSLTLSAVKHWILSNTPSADTTYEIAVGKAGKNNPEPAIADETTAPTGVTFSAAANEAGAQSLPDLGPDDYIAIWLKLVVNANAAAVNLDNAVFRVKGDTPA